VLLELALHEKKPDEVLRWHDQLASEQRSRPYGWSSAGHYADRVADAVADTHPERSLAIYRQIVEQYIAQTSPSAYEAAVPALRKLRGLLQRLRREAEWSAYLAELRDKHHRKRRLLEVLDRLQGRRIVDGGRRARRRGVQGGPAPDVPAAAALCRIPAPSVFRLGRGFQTPLSGGAWKILQDSATSSILPNEWAGRRGRQRSRLSLGMCCT